MFVRMFLSIEGRWKETEAEDIHRWQKSSRSTRSCGFGGGVYCNYVTTSSCSPHSSIPLIYSLSYISLQKIGTLEELALPQNGITSKGVEALATCFQSNPNLRIINLNDNTATQLGSAAVAKVLIHLLTISFVVHHSIYHSSDALHGDFIKSVGCRHYLRCRSSKCSIWATVCVETKDVMRLLTLSRQQFTRI